MNNLKDLKTKEEVLEFFRVYFKDSIELAQRKMESEDSFNKVAWGEFQAYQLGAVKVLKKALALIPDREK